MIKNKLQKSFTLLETVVALGILALGIGGLFVSLQDIEMNFGYAKGYMIAAYLNQEAVEFLRNIKDSNIYEPNPADEAYDNGIINNDPDYYRIDSSASDQTGLISISNNDIETKCFSSNLNLDNCYEISAIPEINIRGTAPYYYYGSNDDTKANIKRIVKVQKVSGSDEAGDSYEAVKIDTRTLFKVKNKIYMHKVIHFMYDR